MKKRFISLGILCLSCLLLGTLASCGDGKKSSQKNEPVALAAPTDLTVSLGYSGGMTKHVVSWSPVKNAASYAVSVDGEIFYTDESSYTLSSLTTGDSYQIAVFSCGDEVNYTYSAPTELSYKAETVSSGLSFLPLYDTSYEVAARAGETFVGTLVLPDYYDGLPVVKIADAGFKQTNSGPAPTLPTGPKGLRAVRFPKYLTAIGKEAFSNCSNLRNMPVPEGVTEIGENAFVYCENLETVEFPSTLTTIGISAFDTCIKLESVRIPKSVTTLGEWAFSSCEKLAEVTFEEGSALTALPMGTFSLCYSLTDIKLPETVKELGNSCFSACGFTELPDLSNVTQLGGSAFSNCENLESIVVPAHLTSLGDSVFAQCPALKEITVAEGIADLPASFATFSDVLTDVSLPSTLRSIGNNAFYNCPALTEIVLPDGLSTIGNKAFSLCPNLTTINLPDSLTSLGSCVFENCEKMTGISLSKGFTAEIDGTFSNVYIASFSVDQDNPKYSAKEGDLYSKDGSVLFHYAPAKTDASFTVPEGVKRIGSYAFSGATALTEIVLPSTLEQIGAYAFANCVVSELTFPEGLKEVGDYAFYNCKKIASLTFPDAVETLGVYLFRGCSSLADVTLSKGLKTLGKAFAGCSSVKWIVVPDGVETIETDALFVCYCEYLVVPKSVKKIGTVFYTGEMFGMFSSGSRVKKIYYEGTQAEWYAVEMSQKDNDRLSKITVFFYSEEEPPLNEAGTEYDGNYWHYDQDGNVVEWKKQTDAE